MYSLFIYLYVFAIKVAALFNGKAREWVNGRKNLLENMKVMQGENVIWLHCASLGEYEQGIPLAQKLKILYPDCKILVTFFSPSGFNHRKNIKEVDYYFYMPADTISNISKLLNIVNVKFAVFVKYEFWFNAIKTLHDNDVPIYYVACNFRPDQYFFKWYGKWSRRYLKMVSHFFVQNDVSYNLLRLINVNSTVAGDTRFDRVFAIANSFYEDKIVQNFKGNDKLFVMGSSWEKDEQIVVSTNLITDNYKLLIAPHLIDVNNISRVKNLFGNDAVLYSGCDENSVQDFRVLIVDCIGKLSYLYRYADVAYIGGGFGAGIHNTLEAAAYQIPVIFGPKYKKFNEAVEILKSDAGFSISNHVQLNEVIENLLQNDFYDLIKSNCGSFVKSNIGAVDVITLKIKELNS